ncbi:MAG: HlyD family efflux transporter periplasmic adaptor subunit, partial [Planctomycetales bacterium]|nr:HlyD family efflux transporter periplasmic adaptor subunit [Planctomycetales bacterium]
GAMSPADNVRRRGAVSPADHRGAVSPGDQVGIGGSAPLTADMAAGGSELDDGVWIAAPFRVDQRAVGVVELIQPRTISSTGVAGCERLLAMLADLTGDFLRRRQIDELVVATDQWHLYEALSQRVHASLDLRRTAYQIVNDGRLFVRCDRVCLVVAIRARFQPLAISGVDTFDRRSNMVRSMESLATAVAASGQWLRYRGDTSQLPPQLEQPISAFADESNSQTIDVVPLFAPALDSGETSDELVGVLILERFDATDRRGAEQRIIQLATLSSSALRNAIDYQTLPLLSLARWIRNLMRSGDRRRRQLTIAASSLVVFGVALFVIPATFQVKAEGKAQPLIRRNIYAPLDGEVVEVGGAHDETVKKDHVLVQLRSRELEVELQRLQGEYQTTEKKLLAVASARVQNLHDNDADRVSGQLAAEEQELKQELASLNAQLVLIRRQREQLAVRSPIDGQIMTWDPAELLSDRPVQRGQLLMAVADVNGPWVLELTVPERRVGHLIAAQREVQQPLDVTFTLATGGAPTYRGTVQQIAGRTEVIDNQQSTTRVRVAVPEEAVQMLRPGTAIHAKVNCGPKSLGFVWLHDVYETVRSWLLF